jgi:endonuclease I
MDFIWHCFKKNKLLMKKILFILIIAITNVSFSQDGAPAAPYYNGFNWTLTDINLKNALANITVDKHTNFLTYGQVWNALQNVDLDPTNSANVLLVYGWENGTDADVTNDRTRNKFSNSGANGDWNREHIFAQSLGNPDLGQIGPGADAHMLRACDVQRNATRGNRLYTAGTGNSSTVGSNGWYPGDEWKGDVARIIMYMYLYYGTQCTPTFVTSGVAPFDNMPTLLLQWNAEDPVSQYEDRRNTYMSNTTNFYAQGNRNPFIDNPFLATLIWGGQPAQNRWPNLFLSNSTFESTKVAVYPNPSQDGTINIQSTQPIESIELVAINGQIMQRIPSPILENNVISISNLSKGFYFLRLKSKTDTTIKKVIIN